MRKSLIISACIAFWPHYGATQSFDSKAFIERLNEKLSEDGLTIILTPGDQSIGQFDRELLRTRDNTVSELVLEIPDYGIAAISADGTLRSVFGPNAPVDYDSDGSIAGIRGYKREVGDSFQIIGSDEYVELIASTKSAGLDESFTRAIDIMSAATDYVAESMCNSSARPSEITVSVSADFKLVFGAATGTTAKWVLEETCRRRDGN